MKSNSNAVPSRNSVYDITVDKLCVIFTGDQYQSWLDSQIISRLSASYDLEIVTLNSNFNSAGTLNFQYTKNLTSIRNLYLLNQLAQINLSKSFKFRLRRMFLGSINLSGRSLSRIDKLKGSFFILRNLIGYSRKNYLQIFASLYILRIFFEFYYKRKFEIELVKIQKSEKNFIKNLGSSTIVFPTSGADLLAFELLALCKLESKNSIFVIENWDNLTSKTTFPFNPDYITVMGERSVLQAQSIHGFARKSIAVTGLPRFEKYGESRIGIDSSFIKASSKKILYLGFSLPYNEIRVVKGILSHLQTNYLSSEFEMHYKPHPFRQKRFVEDIISIDERADSMAIKVWDEKKHSRKYLPLINDDYLSFLSSFDIVITTPTTMALEVMMLEIPCIIDSGDDGIHLTSPWHAMNNYLHLEDLLGIPEVRIAKTEYEIFVYLDELMKSERALQKYSMKEIVETQQKFSSNLIQFLKTINV